MITLLIPFKKTYCIIRFRVYSITGRAITNLDTIEENVALVKVPLDSVFSQEIYDHVYKKYICRPESFSTVCSKKPTNRTRPGPKFQNRTPRYPKSPSEAQKLYDTEKKNWQVDPEIPIKLGKWYLDKKNKQNGSKKEEKETTKNQKSKKIMYIYPYKDPYHQHDKLNRKSCSLKNHYYVKKNIKQEKLKTTKFRTKIPYKPPLRSHNCIFRHWSTERIQNESYMKVNEVTNKSQESNKKKKGELPLTKVILTRCLKPGLKPKEYKKIPNECSFVRKTINDFLPKYLKQTHDANVCKETQILRILRIDR